jgi:hypothetical protein
MGAAKNLKIDGLEYSVNIPAFIYEGKDVIFPDLEKVTGKDGNGNPTTATVKGVITVLEEGKDLAQIAFFTKAIEWLLDQDGQQVLTVVKEGGA